MLNTLPNLILISYYKHFSPIYICAIDVRTVTTIEGYTPLHLAARYNPHGDYELAAKAKAKASGDNEGSQTDYKSYTLSFRRQQSSEAAIKYLMEKVDVSFKFFLSVHCA